MKTFKILCAIVFLSVIAISCNNNNDDDSVAVTRKNLILKATDADDKLISTYKYDSNNQLINYKLNGNEYNAPRDYNFSYNADGTLDKITNESQDIVYNFFYDSNRKIVKKQDQNTNVYLYTYDGNVITENYKYLPTGEGWRSVYTYDDNGNIANIKYYKNVTDANPLGTYSGIAKYTYDNKMNAKSSLPEAFSFPVSVNNTKTTQYDDGPIYSFSYEYNEDNYPTKVIEDFVTYEYQQL